MSREPISWLLLERYALGEVSPEERADVEARLAESETDRACLAQIRADTSQLPPLPASSAARAETPARPRPGVRVMAFAGALCAAAVALLMVLKPQPSPQHTPDVEAVPAIPTDEGVKGSEVFLHLISDRQGDNPRSFTIGERFKLELSCPPRLGGSLRLFVFQGEQVSEPLPLAAPLACGNLVPWPGAFALDSTDPAEICVSWARELGEVHSSDDLGGDVRCVRLTAP